MQQFFKAFVYKNTNTKMTVLLSPATHTVKMRIKYGIWKMSKKIREELENEMKKKFKIALIEFHY